MIDWLRRYEINIEAPKKRNLSQNDPKSKIQNFPGLSEPRVTEPPNPQLNLLRLSRLVRAALAYKYSEINCINATAFFGAQPTKLLPYFKQDRICFTENIYT